MDLQLSGMPALVFGGGSGLGSRIAERLADEGARVAVADLNQESAEATAARLGSGAIGLACDITERAQVHGAVEEAVRAFGPLKIAVQAVGLTLVHELAEITEQDARVTHDVNMRGSVWIAQAAGARMTEAGYGRLVFIGSASGMKGSAGLALYSASKFFLRGLAHAVGLELGPAGVTANVICPTDVYPEPDSPAGTWHDEKLIAISCRKEGVEDLESLKRKRVAKNPMRRSCTADDVADMAVFLCSPRAGFINAQTLGLNGGLLPT